MTPSHRYVALTLALLLPLALGSLAASSAGATDGARAKVCFSKAEYKKVKNGMTKHQVVKIIGGKANAYWKSGKTLVGQWDACGRSGGPYYVAFSLKTDKVVDKSLGPCYGRAALRC